MNNNYNKLSSPKNLLATTAHQSLCSHLSGGTKILPRGSRTQRLLGGRMGTQRSPDLVVPGTEGWKMRTGQARENWKGGKE